MGGLARWLSVLALLVLCGGTPLAARAQAGLLEASPPAGALLATAPARVDLVFTATIDPAQSRIRVTDTRGVRVDRDDLQVSEKRMTIGVQDLPPGQYRVRWVTIAETGGAPTRAEYTFGVGIPAPGQPRLQVVPDRTDAGQLVTISGEGFSPNAVVILATGDEQAPLAVPQTDAAGRFTLQILVPEYLPHGRQVVQALDLADRMATAAMRIARGGWPPLAVELHVHADEPNRAEVEIRLVNRSGWHLRNIEVRAAIPPGTRVLPDSLEGPEGVEPVVQGGQVRWRSVRANAHTYVDGFAYTLDSSALPLGERLAAPAATVTFEHGALPLFRGQVATP